LDSWGFGGGGRVTSEARTFIEAKDLTGIEIECQQCHSAVFYPIAALKGEGQISPNCPQCNRGLFDVLPPNPQATHAQYPIYPAINDLHKIAVGLRALISERTDIHANVCFRIDAELSGK
jgi:hypothetical protein